MAKEPPHRGDRGPISADPLLLVALSGCATTPGRRRKAGHQVYTSRSPAAGHAEGAARRRGQARHARRQLADLKAKVDADALGGVRAPRTSACSWTVRCKSWRASRASLRVGDAWTPSSRGFGQGLRPVRAGRGPSGHRHPRARIEEGRGRGAALRRERLFTNPAALTAEVELMNFGARSPRRASSSARPRCSALTRPEQGGREGAGQLRSSSPRRTISRAISWRPSNT
jgi:hypothetical protein